MSESTEQFLQKHGTRLSPLDLSRERANRLRIALLHEWQRVKVELAHCEKPSFRAVELEANIEVMAAVLRADGKFDAAIESRLSSELDEAATQRAG